MKPKVINDPSASNPNLKKYINVEIEHTHSMNFISEIKREIKKEKVTPQIPKSSKHRKCNSEQWA